MTISRDEFEDLKQLLATAARLSERNTHAIDRLVANQLEIQQDIQVVFHRMESMQADIRGLQTENRRILERLERHFLDGHGAA